MMGEAIDVDWIKWGERSMTVRGCVWLSPEPTTLTVSYAHVAASQLWLENDCDGGKSSSLLFVASGQRFVMRFQDEGNARDAAAEMARRMEMR